MALALDAEPELARRLAGLVHMGGSFNPPGGEPFVWRTPDIPDAVWQTTLRFNTLFDPEASANVTSRVFQRRGDIARLKSAGSAYHKFLATYGRPWVEWSIAERGLPGAHMHDPLTVAAIIVPEFFRFREMRVETAKLLRGEARWLSDAPSGIRAKVAVDVDAGRFEAWLAERLCRPVRPRYRG